MGTDMEICAKKFRLITKIVTIVCLVGTSIAFAGGESSGGGSICFRNGQPPELLDLAVNSDLAPAIRTSSVTNPPLKLGKIGTELGYEKIRIQDLHAYGTLMARLETYQKRFPRLSNFLKKAVTANEFRMTSAEVAEAQDSFIDSSSMCESIVPAVLFTKRFGAFTVLSLYNQLNDINQAGLILHEALRLIQKVWLLNGHPDDGLQTETIQRLVAIVMYQDPWIISETEMKLLSRFIAGSADLKAAQAQGQFQKIGLGLCQKNSQMKESLPQEHYKPEYCKYATSNKLIKVDDLINELRKRYLNNSISRAQRNKYYEQYENALSLMLEINSNDINIGSIELQEAIRKYNSILFDVGEDLIFKRILGQDEIGFFDFELNMKLNRSISEIQQILKK